MKKLSSFVVLMLMLFDYCSCDKLIDLYIIFRHGERVPEKSYPTDPLKHIWTEPPGELTKNGQLQAFNQGRKIKLRYVDEIEYMTKDYWSRDLVARSTFLNRTLSSGLIFMTAFYLDSDNTHPNDPRWPKGWNPIPFQTVPYSDEYLLLPFDICNRFKKLSRERELHPKVQQLMLEEKPFLEKIAKKAGLNVTNYSSYDEFWGFKDAVLIQKSMNLNLPEWITEDLWDRFINTRQKVYYFVKGESGFNEPENSEMTAIGSGVFLQTLLHNIERKINNQTSIKMHFYSAHDSTISYILRALGPKAKVVGNGAPGFGATLAFEIWEKPNGEHYLMLQYWHNYQSKMKTITKFVIGCLGDNQCSLNLFKNQASMFFPPQNIRTICEDDKPFFLK